MGKLRLITDVALGLSLGVLFVKVGPKVLKCIENSINKEPFDEVAREVKEALRKSREDLERNFGCMKENIDETLSNYYDDLDEDFDWSDWVMDYDGNHSDLKKCNPDNCGDCDGCNDFKIDSKVKIKDVVNTARNHVNAFVTDTAAAIKETDIAEKINDTYRETVSKFENSESVQKVVECGKHLFENVRSSLRKDDSVKDDMDDVTDHYDLEDILKEFHTDTPINVKTPNDYLNELLRLAKEEDGVDLSKYDALERYLNNVKSEECSSDTCDCDRNSCSCNHEKSVSLDNVLNTLKTSFDKHSVSMKKWINENLSEERINDAMEVYHREKDKFVKNISDFATHLNLKMAESVNKIKEEYDKVMEEELKKSASSRPNSSSFSDTKKHIDIETVDKKD